MELCQQLGEKLGLKDGEQVYCHSEQLAVCALSTPEYSSHPGSLSAVTP